MSNPPFRYTYDDEPSSAKEFTELFRAAGFPMMTDRQLLEHHHQRLALILKLDEPGVWTIGDMLDEVQQRLEASDARAVAVPAGSGPQPEG